MKKIYPRQLEVFKINSKRELLGKLSISEKQLLILLPGIPECYFSFKLKKKDGGNRDIVAPNKQLKQIQKLILANLLEKVKLPKCVFGGLKGKSIIENAKQHINGKYLLNIDLKNFFPNVHWQIINKLFLDLGCSEEVTTILTRLTTLNWALPQGAPTSPYLANLVLTNLDYRFYNLSKANHLIYTRYFDDICISGNKQVELLKNQFLKMVKEEGYSIKIEKIELYKPNQIKKVTGILIVNKQLDIENKNELSDYLSMIKKGGLAYLKSNNIEKEKQSLVGKINFIKSVNLEIGKKLKKEFQKINWGLD